MNFRIGHNLHLALRHLRSPTHPLNIWVDALCINQADNAERNHQVSLMAFIYTRAKKVVAWLGRPRYRNDDRGVEVDFQYMTSEWRARETQNFGRSLMEKIPMQYSPNPSIESYQRMLSSLYWTRLWIVQEICIPRVLVLAYGARIWTFEEFQSWTQLREGSPSILVNIPESKVTSLFFDFRDKRHTDIMRLESLVESFATWKCSNPMDGIYGLLGCANDVRPYSRSDDSSGSVQMNDATSEIGLNPSTELRRGPGWIRVDYSCSFYEIWTRIVHFIYFRARSFERNIVILDKNQDDLQYTIPYEKESVKLKERDISIVRFAALVQLALNQRVEIEMRGCENLVVNENDYKTLSSTEPERQGTRTITAVACIAGSIVQLGPDYMALAGSSSATQDWKSCWDEHYVLPTDLEKLRRTYEEYEAKVLDYEHADLARIRALISRSGVFARRINAEAYRRPLPFVDYTGIQTIFQTGTSTKIQIPRICLGSGYVIGLVPPQARVGDIIVQFWNCDTAVVMRPMSLDHQGSTSFTLVGRADVANLHSDQSRWLQDIKHNKTPHMLNASKNDTAGALYVDLDLMTVQQITAHANTL
jgi:hypothetical protein